MESRDGLFWAAVAVGGVGGAWIRWSLARLVTRASRGRPRPFDPGWATLGANLLGCFLLGGFLSLPSLSEPGAQGLRAAFPAFATIGLCGSLSTFSTLCADAVRRVRVGRGRRAMIYVLAHIVGGPLALWLGSTVSR
jgi:fluoride exporter